MEFVNNPIKYKKCDWIHAAKNRIYEAEEWNNIMNVLPQQTRELTKNGNLTKSGFIVDCKFLIENSMSSIEVGAIMNNKTAFS